MPERRRDFVRLEIEKAGMDLFAQCGYDAVTVQDIADAAGIGRRTFFRYFQSKEELLQSYDTRLAVRALHAFQRRPRSESAALALCRAFVSTAEMSPEQEQIAFQRNKVLQEAGADALIPGTRELREQFLVEASSRIRAPLRHDLRPHVIVWTVFAAGRAAAQVWIAESGTGEPLFRRLESAFQQLLQGLDES
jgi:TetR/AcrR family transcriptional regulator, regulator of mycofactocin system